MRRNTFVRPDPLGELMHSHKPPSRNGAYFDGEGWKGRGRKGGKGERGDGNGGEGIPQSQGEY